MELSKKNELGRRVWKKKNYRGDEESGSGVIEEDEGETAAEMADDMVGWIWSSITKSFVSFDY